MSAVSPTSSLRRSSRLQSKAVLSYMDPHPSTPAGPSTITRTERKPSAKRPRNSVPPALERPQQTPLKALGPKGRRRILSKLVDMPLDILFEIFGHLRPLDLLHLARTTKALREVLMRRSAVTIWRSALSSVENLPDCPPDLTEPGYANLLFDHHCHFCVKARVMTTLWTCRSRACKQCLKEHFVPLFDILVAASEYMARGPQQLIKVSSMLPMEYLNNKLLVPKFKADELIRSIKECKGDEARLKKLEDEQAFAVQLIKDSALKFTEWQIKQNDKRSADLMDLRIRRRKQITERLCQLGFGEDLKWMTYERVDQFIEHPLVKQPKELTDRIWNNIRAPMVAFAEDARTERLMRERCAHYINRLSVVRDTVVRFLARRPLWEALPSIADFSYHTPGFRALLGAPRDAFYQPLEMPAAQLEAILTATVREWRTTMALRLYDMIERATQPSASSSTASVSAPAPTGAGPEARDPGPSFPAASFASATSAIATLPSPEQVAKRVCSALTWFRCTSPACGALLDYPRVLAHSCAHAAPPVDLHPATDAADLRNAYAIVLEETPWNLAGGAVVFDTQAAVAAEAVVRACGRDPRRTDGWEMEGGKARLVCSLCSKGGQACVMAWQRAVAHLCEHMRAGQTAKVTRLSKRDARLVRAIEPVRLIPHFSSVYKIWGCLRCRVLPAMTLVDMFSHCAVEHMLDMPDEEEDYDLHPDAETDQDVPAHDVYYDASLFLTPIRR